MKILFLPEVEDYLFELIEILYDKEYFGSKESAVNYAVELENDIRTNLPAKIKRPDPPYFDRYGKKMLYVIFEKNKATQWYVFLMYIKNKTENWFFLSVLFQTIIGLSIFFKFVNPHNKTGHIFYFVEFTSFGSVFVIGTPLEGGI